MATGCDRIVMTQRSIRSEGYPEFRLQYGVCEPNFRC